MPPPNPLTTLPPMAELPLTVQLITVSVPSLKSPPPCASLALAATLLPRTTQLLKLSVLKLLTPPPLPFAELPVMMQSRTAQVAWLLSPPPPPVVSLPLLIVSPEMLTMPPCTSKMRNAGVPLAELRWTARRAAPGPEMVKFLTINNSPLVSVIVPLTEKLIVSPAAALAIASRSDPGPLSAVLVTVAANPCRVTPNAIKHKTVAVLLLIVPSSDLQPCACHRPGSVVSEYKHSDGPFGSRKSQEVHGKFKQHRPARCPRFGVPALAGLASVQTTTTIFGNSDRDVSAKDYTSSAFEKVMPLERQFLPRSHQK